MRLLADTSVFSAKETTLLSFTKATTQLFMFSAGSPSFHDTVALVPEEGAVVVLIKILLMHFVLPAVVTLGISEFMRKKGWIRKGDMKLDL